jgi:hypothetical protein
MVAIEKLRWYQSLQKREALQMNKWGFLIALIVESCIFAADATPFSSDIPSTSGAESLVKNYVDKDFIHDELSPPEKCEQYSEKFMFAYDWSVVINKIGAYDPDSKLLLVEATVIVRCGPFRSQSSSLTETDSSDFPLRSETPIDFKMMIDPDNAQQWKIQEVILRKSKQKIIQQ